MHQKLYRSRQERILGGVCGGFGNYWKVDPSFLRLLVIFFTVITALAPLTLLYILALIIIPLEPEGTPMVQFHRLYRSKNDRRIAGVCGGIGEFFNIDSTIVRLVVVIVGLLTAIVPMLAAYGVAWFMIPEQK